MLGYARSGRWQLANPVRLLLLLQTNVYYVTARVVVVVMKQRREDLMSLMEQGSIAILPGALAKFRNANVEYRFRQDSDFHYLSGFDEPDAVLVLVPGGEAVVGANLR